MFKGYTTTMANCKCKEKCPEEQGEERETRQGNKHLQTLPTIYKQNT